MKENEEQIITYNVGAYETCGSYACQIARNEEFVALAKNIKNQKNMKYDRKKEKKGTKSTNGSTWRKWKLFLYSCNGSCRRC